MTAERLIRWLEDHGYELDSSDIESGIFDENSYRHKSDKLSFKQHELRMLEKKLGVPKPAEITPDSKWFKESERIENSWVGLSSEKFSKFLKDNYREAKETLRDIRKDLDMGSEVPLVDSRIKEMDKEIGEVSKIISPKIDESIIKENSERFVKERVKEFLEPKLVEEYKNRIRSAKNKSVLESIVKDITDLARTEPENIEVFQTTSKILGIPMRGIVPSIHRGTSIFKVKERNLTKIDQMKQEARGLSAERIIRAVPKTVKSFARYWGWDEKNPAELREVESILKSKGFVITPKGRFLK